MNTELVDLLRELELKVKKVTTPNFVICEFNNQRELKVAYSHKRTGLYEGKWIGFNLKILNKEPDFLLARVDEEEGDTDYYGAWYTDAITATKVENGKIKSRHKPGVGPGGVPLIDFEVDLFAKGKLKIYQALLHGRMQSVLL